MQTTVNKSASKVSSRPVNIPTHLKVRGVSASVRKSADGRYLVGDDLSVHPEHPLGKYMVRAVRTVVAGKELLIGRFGQLVTDAEKLAHQYKDEDPMSGSIMHMADIGAALRRGGRYSASRSTWSF